MVLINTAALFSGRFGGSKTPAKSLLRKPFFDSDSGTQRLLAPAIKAKFLGASDSAGAACRGPAFPPASIRSATQSKREHYLTSATRLPPPPSPPRPSPQPR